MKMQMINLNFEFLTIVAVTYSEPRKMARPTQYKGEIWLKIKSKGESIDRG